MRGQGTTTGGEWTGHHGAQSKAALAYDRAGDGCAGGATTGGGRLTDARVDGPRWWTRHGSGRSWTRYRAVKKHLWPTYPAVGEEKKEKKERERKGER